MWRFFWLLIILFFSIWIGLKISEDPGYALFAYRHWTVEMPLWFTVIIFLVILFLLYGILRFFDGIDFSLYRFKNWLRWRRKHYSYSKTHRGLIELLEGRWHKAEQYLLEGIPQSDAPLINYLAAAKAAQEQQANNRCDKYLQKASQLAPQADIAIGLTQAQLQIHQGQLEQALATLKHLQSIAPRHAFVLKLLEKVYIRLSDWRALLTLLPSLRKIKLISDNQFNQFEENIYQALLQQIENKEKKEKLEEALSLWKIIPKKLRQQPTLIHSYIKLLLPYPEKMAEIENLLQHTLKKVWDKELTKLYGLLTTSDPKKQLRYAEDWHKKYGDQAILLLTLGRLCIRCQLWGKARQYLTESLKLDANPETYAEYGKLLEKLGDTQAALYYYREGLGSVDN